MSGTNTSNPKLGQDSRKGAGNTTQIPQGHEQQQEGVQRGDPHQFSILPHPAKTNDPADLVPTEPGRGFSGLSKECEAGIMAHHAKGPYVPSEEILKDLPKPLTREELQARAAELNK